MNNIEDVKDIALDHIDVFKMSLALCMDDTDFENTISSKKYNHKDGWSTTKIIICRFKKDSRDYSMSFTLVEKDFKSLKVDLCADVKFDRIIEKYFFKDKLINLGIKDFYIKKFSVKNNNPMNQLYIENIKDVESLNAVLNLLLNLYTKK